MQEKLENAAKFPRLGLSSTVIRHENGAIWKRRLYVLVRKENT